MINKNELKSIEFLYKQIKNSPNMGAWTKELYDKIGWKKSKEESTAYINRFIAYYREHDGFSKPFHKDPVDFFKQNIEQFLKNRMKEEGETIKPKEEETEVYENLFDKTSYDKIPIPYKLLPKPIVQYIEEEKKVRNFNIDLFTNFILGNVSCAIGNTLWYRSPNGYEGTALLWILGVARKGANKSKPLEYASKPLTKITEVLYNNYLIKRESMQDDEILIPTQIFIDDFTIESVLKSYKNNRKGLNVKMDEIMRLLTEGSRYSGASSLTKYLEIWSGSEVNINRDNKWLMYQNVFMSIFGTTQPANLYNFAKGNLYQSGFFDRFLISIPDDLKQEHISTTEPHNQYYENYERIITAMYYYDGVDFDAQGLLFPDQHRPTLYNKVPFNNDAATLVCKYQNALIDETNNAFDDNIAGALSKYQIYLYRIILNIHALRYFAGDHQDITLINKESVEIGYQFLLYYKANMYNVYFNLFDITPIAKLKNYEKVFYEALPENTVFELRDALRMADEMMEKGMIKCFATRTVKNFMQKKDLFEKVEHGKYKRLL